MHPFALVRLPTLDSVRARVHGDGSRLLRAGGIDLLDRIKEGINTPSELVELRAISDESASVLTAFGPTSAQVGAPYRIGALRTLGDLGSATNLPPAYAALVEAAGSAATPGIRNAATLGGNLLQRPRCWYYRNAAIDCLKKGGDVCHSITGQNRHHAILGGGPTYIVHPSSAASALIVLDASAIVRKADATPVTMPFEQLFVPATADPRREHVLEPGDVLLAIELAAPGDRRSAYAALREKQAHDWPLVEAAASLRMDQGRMTQVRVGLGHVAPTPWRARIAESKLEGQAPSAELFVAALTEELRAAKPLRDNGYKIPAAIGLGRDVLHRVTGLPIPE